MKSAVITALGAALLCAEEYYDRGKLVTLTPEKSIRSVQNSDLWYRTENGARVGTTGGVMVQWKNPSEAEVYLKSLGITEFEWLTEKMMHISVPAERDLFAFSRTLSESGKAEFAHPEFRQERTLR